MSDWQVGDLALCVDVSPPGPGFRGPPLLREGGIYTVSAIGTVAFGATILFLAGVDSRLDTISGGYSTCRFRKIRPDKHEKCEPEFVTLLKRKKVAA